MSFKTFLDMQLTSFNLHYIPIEIYILKLDLVWGFDLQNNLCCVLIRFRFTIPNLSVI